MSLDSWRPTAIVCLVFLGLFVFALDPATAQSSNPVYWRYDAPGRLDGIYLADVNTDGVEEFLVVSDDFNIILVGSGGQALWSAPFQATQQILQVLSLDTVANDSSQDEIVIGTRSQLILLDQDGQEVWQRPLPAELAALGKIRRIDGETYDTLVALSNGLLMRFDGEGQITWRYEFTDSPAEDASPRLRVVDIDRNGQDEIIFSYFSQEGFSKLVLIDGDGLRRWERSDSGSVSALTVVEFDPNEPLEIALGTTLNRVYLYTADGQRRWPYRSPNKPITSLAAANLSSGPALIVGTSVGTVIAYDRQGRRLWGGPYGPTSDREIVTISSAPSPGSQGQPVALSITVSSPPGSTEPADVILLDDDGRRLEPSYPASDSTGLTRLVDINHDGKSELLLAGFATMELLDPGIGVREYSEAWDYRLGAAPQSVLVADIDLDKQEELLIGTDDGKLHALESDGSVFWVTDLGGIVSYLAIAAGGDDTLPQIIAAHNSISLGEDGLESSKGLIEVLRPDGRPIWSEELPTSISSILVGDINLSGRPELIVGTTDGQVVALSLTGEEFWRTAVNGSAGQMLLVNGVRGPEIMIASGANTIDRFNNKGSGFVRVAEYLEQISSLDQIVDEEGLESVILVTVEDGSIRGLNTRGNQLWELGIDGLPAVTQPASNSLLVATDEQDLVRVDLEGNLIWREPELGRISSLYWGDLDGDVRPDVALGNRDGEVRLISADGQNTWGHLSLASEVFHLSAFRHLPEQQAELIAITDNGVVQLYRSQANRPPLLINPQTEVGPGKYSVNISVVDVERDSVTVALELFDPQTEQWVSAGERVASNGNDTLFWTLDPPENISQVRYRLQYDDGSHQSLVEPVPGPAAIRANPFVSNAIAILAILLTGSAGALLIIRQARLPAARVRRFYKRIKQQPDATLEFLEQEYLRTGGSPDLFLNLASTARKEHNKVLASLADGLYLLSARPESALPIIVGALEDANEISPPWHTLKDWHKTYRTGHALLAAPSITELSLLRPQLKELLRTYRSAEKPAENIEGLLTVLASLRDSERVDLTEDRLVYLNEAIGLLKKLKQQSIFWQIQIVNALVIAIVDRWLGLVKAEVEELQGRAQLVVNLMTEQLVPDRNAIVALEISNVGRAPAEQIVIELEDDPAYRKISPPQRVAILSPGRKRQIHFTVEPKVDDRFRILFSIYYSDRHSHDKHLAFADMVHLLPPVHEFEPIINPYSPGMPLRPNSTVFFGREDLFDFVYENAGRQTRQNVLILIGQRRTGKTSALLQLDRRLPENLLPVYIDCQSLGVVPGMPALFHDLAWAISDALATKGFELPVPHPTVWQEDPAGRFQRQFIPAARELLPEGLTILLIFDEFEAFEHLVADGYLPPTLFTYLRHLMQHGSGLSFIFAGTHRLEEMGSDYWSVLFNIALYRHVGFLSDEAAKHLIRDPVAPNIIYDDLAIDKILRVTAGHPYFLQLVCYSLINRANATRSGYVTISDVNEALDEMLRLGEVHFAYLWQRSDHTEKALLAAAAQLTEFDMPFHPSELVQYLAQYSIYLDPAQVTTGLNRLVEREIMSELASEGTPLYELRVGLVGLWVSQNKSLSRLYQASQAPESRSDISQATSWATTD